MLGTVVRSDSPHERPSHSCRTVGTRGGPGELCSAVSPERVMNPTGTRPPGPEHRAPDEQPVPRVVSYGGASSPTLSWCRPRRGASTTARSCSPTSVTTANTAGPSRNDADEAGMGVDDRGSVGGAPDGQAVVLLLDVAVSGDDHAKGATGLGGRWEDLHVRACTERHAGDRLEPQRLRCTWRRAAGRRLPEPDRHPAAPRPDGVTERGELVVETRRAHLEQARAGGKAAEHERAKVAQLGSGVVAAEGVVDRRRADDLAAVGDGADPRNFVDGQAEVLAAGDRHRSAVDADPHPESNAFWPAVVLDSLLRRHRRRHRVPRGRKDVKQAVAFAAHRAAVMVVEGSLEHPLVHSQQQAVAPFELAQEHGRALDVGEQEREPALRISHREALSRSIQIVSPGMANPATLRYVRDVALPCATDHGIELHELRKVRRDGTVETLHGRLVQPGSRSLPIPMRTPDTGAPGTRSCTLDFKIRVIGRWLRQHGASRTNPATVAVAFSTDEVHRANRKRAQPWETPDYPLLELGLSRFHCEALVFRAGLPVPPRSACYFCPS